MKSNTRRMLTCSKRLPNGILEQFDVWVLINEVQEIKAQYEGRGYKVV